MQRPVKNWKHLYTRKVKIRRARKLGWFNYPRPFDEDFDAV